MIILYRRSLFDMCWQRVRDIFPHVCSGDDAGGQSKEPVLIFQPLRPLKKILLRLRQGFKEFSMDRHVKQ